MKYSEKHIMLENKSLLDEFSKMFDANLVCGNFKQTFFLPTEQDLLKIFSILNRLVFDEKLKDIPIFCLPKETFSVMLKDAYDLDSNAIDKAKTSYAMYVVKPEEVYGELIPGKECIVFNTSYGNEPFGFVVSCICHEMIHYYDVHYGDFLKHAKNGVFDHHSTITFLKFMKKAKDQWDIPITIHGNDNPNEVLYKSAQEFFTRDSITETDESSENVWFNGTSIVKKLSKKHWIIIEMD